MRAALLLGLAALVAVAGCTTDTTSSQQGTTGTGMGPDINCPPGTTAPNVTRSPGTPAAGDPEGVDPGCVTALCLEDQQAARNPGLAEQGDAVDRRAQSCPPGSAGATGQQGDDPYVGGRPGAPSVTGSEGNVP